MSSWARSTIARCSRCTTARSRSTRASRRRTSRRSRSPRISTARASARRYIHAYLALAPSGPRSQIIRLADDLLDPVARCVDRRRASRRHVAARRVVRGDEAACVTFRTRAETVVRIARATRARIRRDTPSSSREHGCCASRQIVNGLQFRGHLRDALRARVARRALVADAGDVQHGAVRNGAGRFRLARSSSVCSRSRRGSG